VQDEGALARTYVTRFYSALPVRTQTSAPTSGEVMAAMIVREEAVEVAVAEGMANLVRSRRRRRI